MENDTYTYNQYRPSSSSARTFAAIFAGIAILGFVAFVALNTDTQSLRGISLYAIEGQNVKDDAFEGFIRTFKKFYLSKEEKELRREIFFKNFDFIKQTNLDETKTYSLEINQYADLSLNEFKILKLGFKAEPKRTRHLYSPYPRVTDVPESVDLRNYLTGVKDQGQCGSCWAFSAIAATEGQYYLKNQETISFSEQELVDCSNSYGNLGCGGGLMDSAFEYIRDNGIHLESEYPYKAIDEQCTVKGKVTVQGTGFTDVQTENSKDLKIAASKQPVSVAVDAGSQGWQFYSKGIINADCGTQLDHGVTVVGYGSENNSNYWLVRNSWGASWGEAGHVRIARTDEEGPGMCGIALDASYPILA